METTSKNAAVYKKHITRVLDRYKCKREDDYLVFLPVFGADKNIIAYLRPITKNYLRTIPDCVELMSKWRIENPTIGTGTFKVTNERTRKWLDNFVIDNEKRIIFLIQDFQGGYLGHIGLASFEYETPSAEIDSVLRGVKGIMPGLMGFCLQTIIKWGKKALKLKKITLKVFSDNERAVNFYERCGFVKDGLLPLIKVILPDEEKWEIAEGLTGRPAERYYLKMLYKAS